MDTRRFKAPAVTVLTLLAVGGGLWGLGWWTTSMGRSALLAVAQEEGFCTAPQSDCADGVAALYDFGQQEYGMPSGLIDWCLGVDEWADTDVRVRRGGWLKDVAVWVMYLPCGPLLEADNE